MSIFDLIENAAEGDEPLVLTAVQCREAMAEFWEEVNAQKREALERVKRRIKDAFAEP